MATFKPITLNPVESSNVEAVGYDAAGQRFGVRFKRGAEYHYEGVPQKVADSILTAKSIGSAVSANLVKGDFKYSRVDQQDKK